MAKFGGDEKTTPIMNPKDVERVSLEMEQRNIRGRKRGKVTPS
jgi:hypothetical protein